MSDALKPSNKIDHWLYHNGALERPWAVRWWPEGRGTRKNKKCKQRSLGFATPELRDVFIENDFQEDPLQVRVIGRGRKRSNQDREQREEPGNWTDELSEVMARVAAIRAVSGRPYSLLSDVYAAMKQLGFERREFDGGH